MRSLPDSPGKTGSTFPERRLETQSLETQSLKTQSLETQSLKTQSLETQSLKTQSLRTVAWFDNHYSRLKVFSRSDPAANATRGIAAQCSSAPWHKA